MSLKRTPFILLNIAVSVGSNFESFIEKEMMVGGISITRKSIPKTDE